MKVRYGGTLGNMDSLILATFCLGAMVGVVSVSWECHTQLQEECYKQLSCYKSVTHSWVQLLDSL